MIQTRDAAYWINRLQLQPHPEGGYYAEVFRSLQNVLREGSAEIKQACTSIYYLLAGTEFSGFHRLLSDELWYFHCGVALLIHAIDEHGQYIRHEISDTETGSFSLLIPGGTWFSAEIPSGEGFALVSCAVAPGFDFNEFEMADRQALLIEFPQHAKIVTRLCKG